MPCETCGASVARLERAQHVCHPGRKLDYECWQLREGVERFDTDWAEYLASPAGSFSEWYAEHRR